VMYFSPIRTVLLLNGPIWTQFPELRSSDPVSSPLTSIHASPATGTCAYQATASSELPPTTERRTVGPGPHRQFAVRFFKQSARHQGGHLQSIVATQRRRAPPTGAGWPGGAHACRRYAEQLGEGESRQEGACVAAQLFKALPRLLDERSAQHRQRLRGVNPAEYKRNSEGASSASGMGPVPVTFGHDYDSSSELPAPPTPRARRFMLTGRRRTERRSPSPRSDHG
jgi:hypothetical protein